MLTMLRILLATALSSLQTTPELAVENLALRQQLAILMRTSPRPKLIAVERSFWVLLSRFWPGWKNLLVVVKPETVVRWHRAGFRLFWRMKSTLTARPGRPGIARETRDLIRRMARENPTWGAPRIHGELLKLGFDVAERTVQRFMPKRPAPPGSVESWKTFLRNHADDIAAMDFFTVPTVIFRVLYVFVAIHHGSRRILHVNVTDHPGSQ